MKSSPSSASGRDSSRRTCTSAIARGLSLCAILLLAASCMPTPPAQRSTIVAGIVGEPTSLMDERDPGARFMSGLVMEKLVRVDDKDELTPRLAASVPSFENGLVRIVADERDPSGRLVVTFVLRRDLVWHDGAALTTDDVVFAWQLALDAPEETSAHADAALVERVEALDSLRVVFHLRPGVRTPRYALLAGAMPRHLLSGPDPGRDAAYARRPVHAGPFSIVSWQDGSGATFAPFERYALGRPALNRIEVRFFSHREAMLRALSEGDVDTAPAGPLTADLIPRISALAESRGLLPRYVPQEAADMLLFNMRRPPFDDRRARRAVALAIDRRAISQELFGGRPRIPSSYLFPPSWAAADVEPLADVDRQASLSLLAAAGYCVSTRCPTPQQVSARIVVESGFAPRETVARRVADDLRAIGIEATAVTLRAEGLTTALRAGDFDIAITSRWCADPAAATAEYVTGNPTNVTGHSDAWFDLLARGAARALTRAERRPLYAELQRLWTENLPGIPLYQEIAIDVAPASLMGIAPTAHGEPVSWNAATWRFGLVSRHPGTPERLVARR